jgi:hypothetical protein
MMRVGIGRRGPEEEDETVDKTGEEDVLSCLG